MANKDIYTSVKSYKESIDSLYDTSLKERDDIVDKFEGFINCDSMKSKYDELDSEKYDEFDKNLFSFLSDIFDVIESDSLQKEYKKSLNKYKTLLKEIKEID
ncbi:hypothetical protein KO495_05895 [Colwellia sp. D2M02]|uniref:hypothetical protein n=1 Tax=Colwellia sp. D2M02 TaxID=2841562 RepID=UPI001C089D32|nr:hypothetical protein [Colwellia sp. D2M02]MBU2892854.1 hypothetical protein [Colwellia sp. D2M02]